MYKQFGLVLMVNHACNLRCTYCYTGAKFNRRMDYTVGAKAIDRAVNSIDAGGTLELGFFGGEPLLEAPLVLDLIDRARARACFRQLDLRVNLTTNGTQMSRAAWEVIALADLDLAISHDGLPQIHDRHRLTADGNRSSEEVVVTLHRLVESRKDFSVVMVVRPDTVASLADGMRYLRSLGVTRVDPSLDLWTQWTADDAKRLEAAIRECADVWIASLPDFSVSWFDEKTAALGRMKVAASARCGFGDGEIAVAPSGNLYPCERVINDDAPGNAMRLPGHALDGEHFLMRPAAPVRSDAADDGLLCLVNQVCLTETARVLQEFVPVRTTTVGSRL